MEYRNIKYGTKTERRNYSKMNYDIELPNLIEIQTKSFELFLKEGIKKILKDISPIESNNGDLKLYFDDFYLEKPKYNIEDAKNRDITYYSQLFSKARLENVLTKETKESNILITELPLITPSGTFIINGTERVVISQIVRSSGIYFTKKFDSKLRYLAQLIPTRGAWIEYEQSNKDFLYAKLDRSKKIPLNKFICCLGFDTKEKIESIFGYNKFLDLSLKKDQILNINEAIIELYSKLHRGEKVPVDVAREFIFSKLFYSKKYDLLSVGRYKFNQKLDVLLRVKNTYLAKDLIDPETNEIFLSKNTFLNEEIIEKLKNKRNYFTFELVNAENNLENEINEEILTYAKYNKDQTFELYMKDNIINLKTGEILVEKDTLITEQVINIIRKNEQFIHDKVSKYFLCNIIDLYQKHKERKGVFNEVLEVYILDNLGNPKPTIKVIGNIQSETKKQHITVSDIIASISYYLNLYEDIGKTDDIDHLGNRRLRLIGELLTNQFRLGLIISEKNIKDKMSISKFNNITVNSLVNFTSLSAIIKTFFNSSRLSHFMDQINPLAELTQKRRVSALGTGGIDRDRAGIEIRDINNSHYAKLCPIETPEGPSIGLIASLSTYAQVDKYCFIQTPYLKVIKNEQGKPKVSDHIDYLTADQEEKEVIASVTYLNSDNTFKEKKIIARKNGETGLHEIDKITYIDVSPKQIVSVATSSIPFLEHNDASRALMGANMQRQAVPLLIPESPIVGTGIEHRIAKDSGCLILAKYSGYVTYADAQKIVIIEKPKKTIKINDEIIYKNEEEFNYEKAKILYKKNVFSCQTEYKLINFAKSNQDTLILQKPLVLAGDFVNKNDIITDGPATYKEELALGRNVTVAFMTWEGYNYEDAIILSQDLVINDVYTSVHIDKYEIQTRELKKGAGIEQITREVPNVSAEAIKNLDERGIIIPGSEVKEGDILVGKITSQGMVEQTAYERLINVIIGEKSREHKDSSLRVPCGEGGIVQSVKYFSKENNDILPPEVNENIRVYIAKKRKIKEGDKMAGRHGNKGVISLILPKEDLPYMEDGTTIDIILNPLGVPSRMNIGQILEIHLGIAAKKLNIKVATPVFDGVNNDDLRKIIKEANLSLDGKMTLYDGRTGEPFDSPISVGVMYMIKLSHMVEDKLHSRNIGPYTLMAQQPMGGRNQNGGQRFGEMEVWSLYAYGAANSLQEILTIKSDDIIGRQKTYSAITNGLPLPKPSIPESFRVFAKELQALGLYVELINSKTKENEILKSLVENQKKGSSNNI
ncbi:MAG: DNA-directed RNA polymerase subunit beta [Candidatus Phytoplasma pyri]